jgi:hypothetical protein
MSSRVRKDSTDHSSLWKGNALTPIYNSWSTEESLNYTYHPEENDVDGPGTSEECPRSEQITLSPPAQR